MSDLFTPYSDVLKYNPNHDKKGRFSSGSGGSTGHIDLMTNNIHAALKNLGRKNGFESLYESLGGKKWKAKDVIEVAWRVARVRTKSKKAAIAAIGQEHLRLLHQRAKGEAASRARSAWGGGSSPKWSSAMSARYEGK